MNEYSEHELEARLSAAEEAVLNPLSMHAVCQDGSEHHALAINEVSLLRAGPQAARLSISVDGRVRMPELVCDGALVATPAGSTAYNYSAHGTNFANWIGCAGVDGHVCIQTPALAGGIVADWRSGAF